MENTFIAKRYVNYGQHLQQILVVNGMIEAVQNKSLHGAEPIGIGEDLIGKNYKELRGLGFCKVAKSKSNNILAEKPIDKFPAFKYEGVKVCG